MKHMRIIVLVSVGILGVILGAIFAVPLYRKDYARVEFPRVSIAAEVAADSESRRLGLSGRDALADKTGMLFLFDHADRWGIWMKGMRFSIDIVWIKNGAVVDIQEDASAPASDVADSFLQVYRPDVSADIVLEVKSGFVQSYHIRIGDPVAATFRGIALAQGSVTEGGVLPASHVPGQEYFIESLRASPQRGGDFAIKKTLEDAGGYKKFSIAYTAGNRLLTGIMNVPTAVPPAGGFPVLILNHGLIKPELYFSGRGSKREADFFASHGYATIHPDYRGYSSTSPEFPEHHDFYVGYTQDVLGLIDALKRAYSTLIDTSRMGMWGHSMGGGIASRVAVLSPDVRAYVLFAPISADAEDNFYELTPEEIAWVHATYGPAGSPVYQKISPLNYFSDIEAPVQIHHGTADDAVPIGFSEKMFSSLRSFGKKAEYFTYPGEQHEFINVWPLAASRALQFFDKYVKDAR